MKEARGAACGFLYVFDKHCPVATDETLNRPGTQIGKALIVRGAFSEVHEPIQRSASARLAKAIDILPRPKVWILGLIKPGRVRAGHPTFVAR